MPSMDAQQSYEATHRLGRVKQNLDYHNYQLLESCPQVVTLSGIEMASAAIDNQTSSLDNGTQLSLVMEADALIGAGLATKAAAASGSMEDTAQLKAMADVDLDRINRERNTKLQSILNSNIEQRENECSEAKLTLQRQQERVEAIKQHLNEVSKQVLTSLDEEHARQQVIKDEEKTLLGQKKELESASNREKAQMNAYLTKSLDRRGRLQKE